MKLLFVMRHAGFVRNYESTLRQLGAEGHSVHIAIELIERNKRNEVGFGERLMREFPSITMGAAAVPEDDHWARALLTSRLLAPRASRVTATPSFPSCRTSSARSTTGSRTARSTFPARSSTTPSRALTR
jgi:hypothetical protein